MGLAPPRLVLDLRPHAARERKTTCAFAIYVDDVVVWPVRGEEDARLEIQIDDLLSHLTDFWTPLMLRQVYPIDVRPLGPSHLRREAERRWAKQPPATIAAEGEAVSHFEEAHDLSSAFAGIYGLPPFWMLRSGEQVVLETADWRSRLPIADVRAALVAAGDRICEILAQADADHWRGAIEAWHECVDVHHSR
jgi:hypothetical protein